MELKAEHKNIFIFYLLPIQNELSFPLHASTIKRESLITSNFNIEITSDAAILEHMQKAKGMPSTP